ncbi:MAG: hypothetical protein ACRDPW_03255 [Mycobacteriales bacterium]
MTTAHAYEIPDGVELPASLSSAVDEAEHGEVVYLFRGQRRVAAVVPAEFAAAVAAAMEVLEDAADNAAADAALAEGGEPIPWEQVKAELRELEVQGR